MALRLQIISDQRQQLGDRAQIVLGVGGGSIGRAADNDWILPDSQRYVSARHARIQFRDGAYLLEDTSTNGVFVNGSASPISRQHAYEIRDGDLLRFGEYQVRARIDPIEIHENLSASMVAVERVIPAQLLTPPPPPRESTGEIAPSLNLEELLYSEGNALAILEATVPHSEDPEEKLQRARAAARARMEGNTPPLFDVRAGFQTLCRGAGLDASRLPPDADSRMLMLAGQLLREAILGLQDVLRVQSDFQHDNHIDPPPSEADEPAPQALAATDYLLRLLSGHEARRLDAVLLVRQAFAQARQHDSAMQPALRAAVSAFLSHLDPAGIESRAAAREGGSDTRWELYTELFRTLTQASGEQLPHLFAEALAHAYTVALETPRS